MALEVKNVNPEFMLTYMVTTLQLGPFTNDLSMTPSTSMQDMRLNVAKYTWLKEVEKFQNRVWATTVEVNSGMQDKFQVNSGTFDKRVPGERPIIVAILSLSH